MRASLSERQLKALGELDREKGKRIAELEAALRELAIGRKACASGTQRISRDEMKNRAREHCIRLGIDWQPT